MEYTEKRKEIIKEISIKECLLDDLVEKYNLSELEIMGIVHDLKAAGNNVHTIKKIIIYIFKILDIKN